MNSVHPDFQNFSEDLSHDSEILAALRAQPAEAVQTLNGELAAMANAAIVKGKLAVAVPTLELKISFFEAMGPGIVYAEGRVMRWGGSVGFLDGDLKDEKGRLIAHATSTVKIVRPKVKSG